VRKNLRDDSRTARREIEACIFLDNHSGHDCRHSATRILHLESVGRAAGAIRRVLRLPVTSLLLKRASASRSSGEWSESDYDVLADGVVIGRIMRAAAALEGMPWIWTLIFGYHEDRSPTHGL
jgi:hypothetical protein